MTTGYAGSAYDEYWKIWVDLNGDADFDDAGELVYDAGGLNQNSVSGSFTIPTSATNGNTRLRVSMKYNGAQTACEAFDYGEVEDYTADITDASGGGSGGGSASDLFISEYMEGTGTYDRAIEIANFTGASVDLSNYSLKKNTNGGTSWSSELTLSGTLADGEVFVITRDNAGTPSQLTAVSDLATTSSLMSYTGNDPIGLFKNGTLIDEVGTFGAGSANFGYNEVHVRKSTIEDPNSTYTTSEWDVYPANNFTYIGDHTFGSGGGSGGSGGGSGEIYISEYMEGTGTYDRALEIANFTGASVDLSAYTLKRNVNGGSSWNSSVLNLSGTLADGEVFVITRDNASTPTALTSVSDLATTSTVMSYTGNDPIGLFKNGVLIDIVGTFQGGSANFGYNEVHVRKSTVTGPNTTYTTSEWEVYSANNFTYIGSHTQGSGGKRINGAGSIERAVELYPNPVSGDEVTLKIQLPQFEESVVLKVLDVTGKVIHTNAWGSLEGTTEYKVALDKNLAAGMYFVSLSNKKFNIMKKLQVTR